MATAEELLANAIGDAGDNILTIDLNARVINIPKGITNIGVMSDDDVLRLNFSMPRYYGEYDLSEFQMQINYLNAKKYGDVYKIEDAVVDTDTITFSWLVGRYAVTYVGEIRFNLCFKKYDTTDTSVVIQEFNTTPAALPVLEGLETSEAIVQEYADILAKWESQLFGIGDTAEQRITDLAAEKVDAITNLATEKVAAITQLGNDTIANIQTEVHNEVLKYCQDNNMQVPSDTHINNLIATYLAEHPLTEVGSLTVNGDLNVTGTITASKVVGAVYQ